VLSKAMSESVVERLRRQVKEMEKELRKGIK
jgi:hypothetical protein